ncbi:MAG: hypothetical protein ABJG41_09080 [Cyclobacteriaceae bacterium]
MEFFVFKTDIESEDRVAVIRREVRKYPVITTWSVDTEDCDNVLRVKASHDLQEGDVIRFIKELGFRCESLPD